MKKSVILRALTGGALLCACTAHAVSQPVISGDDLATMKQQQQELAQLKQQLQGMNITLPDLQQNRVNQFRSDIAAAQNTADDDGPGKAPRAVYFLSLGIPKSGLLTMLQDARHFGVPSTLRGLLDNDFRKTASAVFELSKQDKSAGVQIDPTLFSRFGIRAVPALVVTCAAGYDVIAGSLPVRQGLKEIAERGDCAAQARQLLSDAGEHQ